MNRQSQGQKHRWEAQNKAYLPYLSKNLILIVKKTYVAHKKCYRKSILPHSVSKILEL